MDNNHEEDKQETKTAGESKKPWSNPFKLTIVLSSMRVSNYGTIFENRPKESTIKNLKVRFEPEIHSQSHNKS